MRESGCKEFVTPAFVHRLLERDEWKGRPEVYLAIKGEKEDNKPARKPWRLVTNNKRLADSLGMLKCTHDKHAPLEGKYTRNSAFYAEPLCQIMLRALFPHVINAHVFCMPCTPRVNRSHRQHVVKGMPCVPIDVPLGLG